MPMFERAQAPAEYPDEFLAEVNALVERLRARLVDRIDLPEPPTGTRLFNMIRAYLQAHLRRALTFLNGGHAEYLGGRPLMTEMAARAIYESVANICDFSDKLKPLSDAGDMQGIDELATKSAFVTRIPSFLEKYGEHLQSTNVVTQVKKMSKRFADFVGAYDHLSDVAHPNGLGAIVYFAEIGDGVITFGDKPEKAERAIHSLCIAATLLGFMELEMDEIEKRLQGLNAMLAKGA
ncbi:hypothetical protein [Bradyrhizobium sp. SZCCHNS3051]|uniref:hypothetical protein n=1 Tax=Bradyrhizobium sp. SZCCHNS3051 TaxID=3057320 RepID=UPI002915C65F|nr:hypothetical protein [Bradyrhizobium sp. SZCCHNS3051]